VDFFLFLLVNFTLFVRPSEIIPDLAEVPLYNIFIVLALIAAAPGIIVHLNPGQLVREPITVCVLGFWAAIILSHLTKFDLWYTRNNGIDYGKTVIYYLVMIATINSQDRLRRFLYAIALFTTLNASIAIAHFYGYITVPSLKVLEYAEQFDPVTGAPIMFKRMLATGIFGDPNDLSMIAVFSSVIALFGLGDKQLGARRFAWLVPLGILLLTVALTKSRGGAFALIAAVGILTYSRYGLLKAALALALALPLSAIITSGRSEGISGTGDERLMYWAEGLTLMKRSPVFGIGLGFLQEEIRHVAHNSFVQSYVELGIFGGMMFLGAHWFALLELWKLRGRFRSMRGLLPVGDLERLLPYLLSMIIGACISMMSITRCYGVPCLMLLGLVTTYVLECQRQGVPAHVRSEAWRFLIQLPVLSVAFLLLIRTMIQFRLS
jgi:O-antigen ligase